MLIGGRGTEPRGTAVPTGLPLRGLAPCRCSAAAASPEAVASTALGAVRRTAWPGSPAGAAAGAGARAGAGAGAGATRVGGGAGAGEGLRVGWESRGTACEPPEELPPSRCRAWAPDAFGTASSPTNAAATTGAVINDVNLGYRILSSRPSLQQRGCQRDRPEPLKYRPKSL
jgi:hypothetical protein